MRKQRKKMRRAQRKMRSQSKRQRCATVHQLYPDAFCILCPSTLLFNLFKLIQVFIDPTPQPDSSKAPEQPEPPKVTPVPKVNGPDKVDRQPDTDTVESYTHYV